MARHVFLSFHYKRDAYRVSRIKQMGAIDGQRIMNSTRPSELLTHRRRQHRGAHKDHACTVVTRSRTRLESTTASAGASSSVMAPRTDMAASKARSPV
jgi:hypothetical protein